MEKKQVYLFFDYEPQRQIERRRGYAEFFEDDAHLAGIEKNKDGSPALFLKTSPKKGELREVGLEPYS